MPLDWPRALQRLRMKAAFTIPGRLPGTNEIVTAYKRGRWQAGASQKKKWMQLCAWYIRMAAVPVFTRPIQATFKWYEPNRRRDRDNIRSGTKFIYDALKATGRIVNDSQKWVLDDRHEILLDPKEPRVEVLLEEAD